MDGFEVENRKDGRYILGLDLGQMHEHSALALIEWFPLARPQPGTMPTPPTYQVRTLKRWPVGTSYRMICESLVKFLQSPPLDTAGAIMLLDETSVGRPVANMITNTLARSGVVGGWCTATITDGHEVSLPGSSRWHVPKKVLVSVLQVLLQTRRLQVAASLLETETLVRELQAFRTRPTAVRSDTMELWREREYDDMVLSVALACWLAEHRRDWYPHQPQRRLPERVYI